MQNKVMVSFNYFINSQFPHKEHFKMATRCIAPKNGVGRAPSSAVLRWQPATHTAPNPSSKPLPSTQKLRPPHSRTVFFPPTLPFSISPGNNRERSSCISARAGRGSSPPYMPPSSRPVGSHPALHRLP